MKRNLLIVALLSSILLASCTGPKKFLYLQDMDNRSWLPLPNPFIQPAEGQSNPYYSAMYMPAGQNTVIFSAPDDSGAWSIYISSRTDSISWSAPELLSSSITSGHNEIFPVLSNDGNTLYFASDGLPGMGGYDLFKTVRDEETGEILEPPTEVINMAAQKNADAGFQAGKHELLPIPSQERELNDMPQNPGY